MAISRKDQPWGVRTIYRNGRSILVGPYSGRRAAVDALLTGNGRVLSSHAVYLGPDVTGPVRILREKLLGSPAPVVVPGDSEVLDVVYSTTQGYEVEVTGTDLDIPQKFEFTFAAGSLVLDTIADAGAFQLITPTTVRIFTEVFKGEELESLQLRDGSSVAIGADFSFTPILFPRVDTVSSPSTDTVLFEGDLISTSSHHVDVVTDQGTRTYYPIGGGVNPPGATFVWNATTFQVMDPWFSDNAPVTVEYIDFLRLDDTESGYEDVTDTLVDTGPSGPITAMNTVALDENGLSLLGTGLDLYDTFSVVACGNAFTFSWSVTGNPGAFASISPTEVVIIDAAMEGNVIAGASADGSPPLDDAVVYQTLQTAEVYTLDTIAIVGERMDDAEVDSYMSALSVTPPMPTDELVGGFELDTVELGTVSYYRTDGPDAGLNPVNATLSYVSGAGWLLYDPQFSTAGPVEVNSITAFRGSSSVCAVLGTPLLNSAGLVGDELPSVSDVSFLDGYMTVVGQFLGIANKFRFTTSAGVEPEFDFDVDALPPGVIVTESSVTIPDGFLDWIDHTIDSLVLLDEFDVPIIAAYTGLNLPIVIPDRAITNVVPDGFGDFGFGPADQRLLLTGTWLNLVGRALLTTSGDETSLDIAVQAGYSTYSQVSLFSPDLPGVTILTIELFDLLDVSLGVFNITDEPVSEINTILSPATDTVRIEGELLAVIDRVEVDYTDATESVFYTGVYYDSGGPNAGSNGINTTVNTWVNAVIEVEDTDIQVNAPGADRITQVKMFGFPDGTYMNSQADVLLTP